MTLRPAVGRCGVFFLMVAAAVASAQPTAQTGNPGRIGALLDALNAVKHPGAVALSPDGRTVAMVLDGGLTLEPVTGGPTQEVRVCGATEKAQITALSWAPDSAHVGVLASCGDKLSVSLLDAGSRKLHRLAELHGFAEGLAFSPDGQRLGLLYVEGASRPSGALAAMKPPSGVIGVEGLEIQRVATVEVQGGALRSITPADLHVYEFAWSPDGRQIAFVGAPAPGENNWWVAKLYTQATGAAAAAPTVVLDPTTVAGSLHGLQLAVPRWSPDGASIAFIGGLMSDQGATGGDIYLTPAAGGGAPINLTEGAPESAQWIDWLADGRLIETAIRNGGERIEERAPMAGGDAKTAKLLAELPYSVGDGRLAGSFALSKDGRIAAWTASSYQAAPEVYAGPLGSGAALPALTHLNADQKPGWGKTESVEWDNEGFHIQGWLFYPADYDPAKKYPMVVMVHGGPSSAVVPRWPGASFGAAPFSASGYFVLEANPRGSYGEGERFTQANRKDFGYGDLHDILAGVDAVEKRVPAVDDHRLGLTGWSYGGFMTMFGVTQTGRFHAAVAGAGIANWLSYYGENSIDQWMTPFFGATVYDDPAVYARSSAIEFIKGAKTPTLVVVGDRDGECPAPQSFEFWHALKAQGVATQLVIYPNEGHGFVDPAHRRDVMERAVRWFDTHLQ